MGRAAGAEVARRQRPQASPKPRARRQPQRRSSARARARSRAGIVWIVLGGLLLAGVVFVNLGVLRLNLRLDAETQLRNKLRGDNAALQSQLSSSLASRRIQSLAHDRAGLVPADTIGYIDLEKK